MSVDDRRMREAQERVYERARRDGFDHARAKRLTSDAIKDVARRIDDGRITYPPQSRKRE